MQFNLMKDLSNLTVEQFVEHISPFDFAIVIVNNNTDNRPCFRTKEGLAQCLRKHDTTGDKVEVFTGTFDD